MVTPTRCRLPSLSHRRLYPISRRCSRNKPGELQPSNILQRALRELKKLWVEYNKSLDQILLHRRGPKLRGHRLLECLQHLDLELHTQEKHHIETGFPDRAVWFIELHKNVRAWSTSARFLQPQ